MFGRPLPHRRTAAVTQERATDPGDVDMGDPQPVREVMAADRLLLTPEEAAKVLRIGRTTVYALMKSGELRPVHIGRSCRISQAEVERYVRQLQALPSRPQPSPDAA
jgi:excisionase family DNA binding protein